MYRKGPIKGVSFYCLSKAEAQIVLDANDTLDGAGITPVTADLEAYYKLMDDLKVLLALDK